MSELRQDPTTKEWIIFATERAKRPHQFQRASPSPPREEWSPVCPFCPGNEEKTPPEVLSLRDKEGNWRVRVVPNRYPALGPNARPERQSDLRPFVCMGGLGAHEVIVESPSHNTPLALQSDRHIEEILATFLARSNTLMCDPRLKLILIFKNSGLGAGTSLEHPHCQLIATPVVSYRIRSKYITAIRYYDDTGHSLYSDILAGELETGRRIVFESENFVCFHPYASRSAFETWIVPRQLQASFRHLQAQLVPEFARTLKHVLQQLYFGLHNPDYNFVINTAPAGEEDEEYFCWHLQIIPRLTTPAGFELGSGMMINTAFPEETAEFVREVEIGESKGL